MNRTRLPTTLRLSQPLGETASSLQRKLQPTVSSWTHSTDSSIPLVVMHLSQRTRMTCTHSSYSKLQRLPGTHQLVPLATESFNATILTRAETHSHFAMAIWHSVLRMCLAKTPMATERWTAFLSRYNSSNVFADSTWRLYSNGDVLIAQEEGAEGAIRGV